MSFAALLKLTKQTRALFNYVILLIIEHEKMVLYTFHLAPSLESLEVGDHYTPIAS
jgi:hypothetical protein